MVRHVKVWRGVRYRVEIEDKRKQGSGPVAEPLADFRPSSCVRYHLYGKLVNIEQFVLGHWQKIVRAYKSALDLRRSSVAESTLHRRNSAGIRRGCRHSGAHHDGISALSCRYYSRFFCVRELYRARCGIRKY